MKYAKILYSEAIRTILFMVIILLVSSCGSNSTQPNEDLSTSSIEETIATVTNPEAVEAAQNLIKQEYAVDAVFSEDAPIVTETDVDNRYKIQQHFGSVDKQYLDLIYTIWVQKFGDNWEYGTLKVANTKGEIVYISNGRMKELERQEMTRIEAGEVDGVEYTIIERSAPNFVRISTPKRLSNSEIKKVSKALGATYESIFFCIDGKNARGDEYVNVQRDIVFDFRGEGGIKKLVEL